MAIDMFNLTINQVPDIEYLEREGYVTEDQYRRQHYKYFCELDDAKVKWKPHKYGLITNNKMPYCKVDINPKYFNTYADFHQALRRIFGIYNDLDLNNFRVTRIDLASDVVGLPFFAALGRTHAVGYNRTSTTLYEGSTLYIGKTSPRIRIYDKVAEIKARLKMQKKKPSTITDWEKMILEFEQPVTRFEIAVKDPDLTLLDVVRDPYSLVSYFDKLKMYDLESDEQVAAMGGLQFVMSHMRRENKAAFEKYRKKELETLIKDNYLSSVRDWFGDSSPDLDEIPF